jgi:hypothetical protein
MPGLVKKAQTLYDKVFTDHIVDEKEDGTILLYIDRHLVHEVTSPVSRAHSLPLTSLISSSKPSRGSRMPVVRLDG